MTPEQMDHMFPGMPHELFRVHNWRTDVETLGEVPAEFIHEQSEGKLNFAWPAQVNRLISRGGFDLILSIGQVVPHEVIGMANYNKNILVGTGGRQGINLQPLPGRGLWDGAHHGARGESGARGAELCVGSLPARAADCVCADGGGAAARMAGWRCADCLSATMWSASIGRRS